MNDERRCDGDQWVPSPDIVETEVAGETVILDLETGTYFGLDAIGTHIWAALKNGYTFDEICASLCDSYEVDLPRAKDDVLLLLAEMTRQGLIISQPAKQTGRTSARTSLHER